MKDKEIKIDLPDIYAGELNTKRIKTYKFLHEKYNIEEGTVRDIFCAGADWYKELAEKQALQSQKDLVEENEKLKEENEKLKDNIEGRAHAMFKMRAEIKELKEAISKIKTAHEGWKKDTSKNANGLFSVSLHNVLQPILLK